MCTSRSVCDGVNALKADLCPAKPEFRRKKRPLPESIPCTVHVGDGRPQVVQTTVTHGERQEDGPVAREVLVELRQTLEEPAAPCTASAPLAEGA